MLNKISSTWNMEIPLVDAPGLPEGAKEAVRRKDDWDEFSDGFGMVPVRLSIGKARASKMALAEWIQREARVPDIAIGEIVLGDDETIVEIHVRKASYVIEVLKSRKFGGRALRPVIAT
jgi:hypothetical protein